MKKILRTALTLGLVWMGSCTDYGDDFDNLNKRIDALENQIAGFADLNSGVTALDGKVNNLADVLASLPNSTDLGTGLASLQEQLDALEAAMAALDANDTDIQEQVDALNDALALLNDDLQELLDANNVYSGDMIILNEAALDEVLASVADMETLIIDGAFVIDANYTVPSIVPEEDRGEESFMPTPFSAAKVNQLTSKIVAILGHDWSVGLVEEDDDSIYGEYGEVPFAGEIKDVDGALDLSNLVSLTGHIEIGDIAGNVDLSSLTRARFIESLEFNYREGDIIDGDEYGDLDDVYDDELIDGGGLIFDDIAGDVDLSSLQVAWTVKFEDVIGEAKLGSLANIMEDLAAVRLGSLNAPVLREVGQDLQLEYGGGYEFPELVWVDDEIDLVDVEGDNPTVKVDFPKLAHVGSPIQVHTSFESLGCCGNVVSNGADNTFSNATYINILGFFTDDYEIVPNIGPINEVNAPSAYQPLIYEYGFGAPKAETVILNGDLYDVADESVIKGNLYVDAPEADVTLNFTYTEDYRDSGDLTVIFKSLTADNLVYVDGNLNLVGPADGVANQLEVSMPELAYIYGYSSIGMLQTQNIASFSAPKYVQTVEMDFNSNDLISFTAGAVADIDLDFSALESLGLESIRPIGGGAFTGFNLDSTRLDPTKLKSLSLTGLTKEAATQDYYIPEDTAIEMCDNNIEVFIGSVVDNAGSAQINPTAFTALETVTLANIKSVQMVGTTLTTFTASGEYADFDSVNNVIATTNATWTQTECPDTQG